MTHPSTTLAYALADALDHHAHAMEPPSIGFVWTDIEASLVGAAFGAFVLILVAAFSPVLQFLIQRRRRAPVHPVRFGSSHVRCDREIK